jgi:hypothetical protein
MSYTFLFDFEGRCDPYARAFRRIGMYANALAEQHNSCLAKVRVEGSNPFARSNFQGPQDLDAKGRSGPFLLFWKWWKRARLKSAVPFGFPDCANPPATDADVDIAAELDD